jgi:hypothetical protein
VSAKLAAQTQKTAGIPNGMRTATVTAVSGAHVTISVSGGTFSSGVGVVTSYAPKVGDVVAVFRQDSSWLILGPTSAVNPWQSMAALGYQSGWTDRGGGFPIGQYRIAADEVKIVGQINASGTPANPSIIVSGLPAPTGEIIMTVSLGNASRLRLSIDATGTMRLYDNSTGTGTLGFSGAYPLDARLS